MLDFGYNFTLGNRPSFLKLLLTLQLPSAKRVWANNLSVISRTMVYGSVRVRISLHQEIDHIVYQHRRSNTAI
jgi:hypothetical protein